MLVTKANMLRYMEKYGLVEIQVDSIPEGFSFQEPDIEIGFTLHKGMYIAFLPMSEWAYVKSNTIEDLLDKYKSLKR